MVANQHPRAAPAKAEGLIGASLRLAHHEQENGAEEDEGQEVYEYPKQTAQTARPHDSNWNAARVDSRIGQSIAESGIFLDARRQLLLQIGSDSQPVSAHLDIRYFVAAGHLDDLVDPYLFRARHAGEEREEDRKHCHDDQ